MKHFVWRWLVVSSVLVAALMAQTRPQYGGTLRVQTRSAVATLDRPDVAQPDSFARRTLTMLLFDTLVTTDANGRVQPALAVSWQVTSNNQRWEFHLRRGVKFHDGTPLTGEIVAACLRVTNPSWNVTVDGDSIVIGRDVPDPTVLAALTLPRNAIVKRDSDRPVGTGPFHIVDWQPGKQLTLAAEEGYWRGRPYLDGIEIEIGRSSHDQMIALDLGKADMVEIPAEQLHRASLDGRNLASSSPVDLLALVFTRDATTPDEKALREALGYSVERASIRSVLLQGAGVPGGGVLPNWISGYEFVFPTDADLARARHARERVRAVPTWTLGYDSSDSVARLIAERVALNAKDAGLSLQPTSNTTSDLRLVRIPLASADPWIALEDVAKWTGAPIKGKGETVEDLFAAEQSVLASQRIIPLFHLPVSYAASPLLKNWVLRPDGTLNLADAYIGSRQP